jgi:hypothetical protein
MYVVWGRQVHPIVQWFVVGTSPWQHLDQFEIKSSAKVVKGKNKFFFLTQENVVCVKPCL